MNTLETDRLILRLPAAGDLDAYADMWSDAEMLKYIVLEPQSRGQSWGRLQKIAGSWGLSGYGQWLVLEKTSGRLVGQVGFFDAFRGLGADFDSHREAGWVFNMDVAGKGYATEAMLAALSWMDEQTFGNQTVCIMAPDNAASIRVAEKCGYTLLRETVDADGAIRLMTREKPVAT